MTTYHKTLPAGHPATPTPPPRPQQLLRPAADGRGLSPVTLMVPAAKKRQWLKAARGRKLEQFCAERIDAGLAERCGCGHELGTVTDDAGTTENVCMVCRLRAELDDWRARVARLEADAQPDFVGGL